MAAVLIGGEFELCAICIMLVYYVGVVCISAVVVNMGIDSVYGKCKGNI